ncbi:MAG TPA: NAD(P)H-binding protein [Puia sp.]
MQNKYTIAILGGTGKSGIYVVQKLISEGFPVRLLHRNPSVIQNPNPLIEWVRGDARIPESVQELAAGCDAVISTLGQPKGEPSIFSEATRNVIRAMDFFQIKRYILITGLNVDTPADKKGLYAASATAWMKTNYPETTADKQLEWEILTGSGLDWTLVRLPLIELTDQDMPISTSLLDCPGEKISATSLAGFLVGQLADKTFIRQAPFIANR